MSTPVEDPSGFAPDEDVPIPYMERTREYYAAIGYTTPYRWAHYVDAPFQPMKKPLGESRVSPTMGDDVSTTPSRWRGSEPTTSLRRK